jgi:integrase/recombinase XerD
MKRNQTFSILFWVMKYRTKNDQTPISARITIDGKRVEISLQRSVNPQKWNPDTGQAKGNSEEAKTLNSFLSLFKADLEKQVLS